jgi:hypothetical protein
VASIASITSIATRQRPPIRQAGNRPAAIQRWTDRVDVPRRRATSVGLRSRGMSVAIVAQWPRACAASLPGICGFGTGAGQGLPILAYPCGETVTEPLDRLVKEVPAVPTESASLTPYFSPSMWLCAPRCGARSVVVRRYGYAPCAGGARSVVVRRYGYAPDSGEAVPQQSPDTVMRRARAPDARAAPRCPAPRGRRPGGPLRRGEPSRSRAHPVDPQPTSSSRIQAGRRCSLNAARPSRASAETRWRAMVRAVCHLADP